MELPCNSLNDIKWKKEVQATKPKHPKHFWKRNKRSRPYKTLFIPLYKLPCSKKRNVSFTKMLYTLPRVIMTSLIGYSHITNSIIWGNYYIIHFVFIRKKTMYLNSCIFFLYRTPIAWNVGIFSIHRSLSFMRNLYWVCFSKPPLDQTSKAHLSTASCLWRRLDLLREADSEKSSNTKGWSPGSRRS